MDKTVALEAIEPFDVRWKVGFSRVARGLDDVTWVQSACHGINRDTSTVKPRGKIRTSIVQAIGVAPQGQRPLSLTLIPIRGHNARLGPDIKFQCLCVGFEPLSKLVLRRKDLCCERIVTLTFDLSSDLPASSEGNSDRACDRTLALISTVGLSASESRNPREEKRDSCTRRRMLCTSSH